MTAFWSFLRSTIGLKVQMAVSGFVLFGFCVEHLVGMMLFFKGPGIINGYARLLQYSPAALWSARTAIILAAAFHVWSATVLYLRQRSARPVGYHQKRSRTFSYAARTMKYSGPFVLAFVFFHIAHFTWGMKVTPGHLRRGRRLREYREQLSVRMGRAGVRPGRRSAWPPPSSWRPQHVRVAGVAACCFDGVIRAVVGGATLVWIVGFIGIPCAIFFKLVGG